MENWKKPEQPIIPVVFILIWIMTVFENYIEVIKQNSEKNMYLCKHATSGPGFQRIHGHQVHQWVP